MTSDGVLCVCAQMIVVDVYNARFHRVYGDKDSLNLIMDRDDIYVYELSVSTEGNEMIHLPIYHREETLVTLERIKIMVVQSPPLFSCSVRDVRYSSTSYQSRYYQLFGLPLVVMVPRESSRLDIYRAVVDKGRCVCVCAVTVCVFTLGGLMMI